MLILFSQSLCCYSDVHSKRSKYMNQSTKPKTFIKIRVFTTYEMLVSVGGEKVSSSKIFVLAKNWIIV